MVIGSFIRYLSLASGEAFAQQPFSDAGAGGLFD